MRDLDVLLYQAQNAVDGGAYKLIQCDFAYNSNHIEGSTLTPEQTRSIFERGTVSGVARVRDVIEAANHFRCVDYVLAHADDPLTEGLVKRLHAILKRGTDDDFDGLCPVGEYKRVPNYIEYGASIVKTAAPDEVEARISALLARYEGQILSRVQSGDESEELAALAEFHVEFESIHPFGDGNGRVGRLLLFKECLRADVAPVLISEDLRQFYLRGIDMFRKGEPGYLIDTFGTASDRFESRYREPISSFADALEDLHAHDVVAQTDPGHDHPAPDASHISPFKARHR